jgi:hypothetical protein
MLLRAQRHFVAEFHAEADKLGVILGQKGRFRNPFPD